MNDLILGIAVLSIALLGAAALYEFGRLAEELRRIRGAILDIRDDARRRSDRAEWGPLDPWSGLEDPYDEDGGS